MSDENQPIAEMIRDGSYFREARGWHQALYISPIAERSFFLIISALALLVAVVSILALIGLMPLHARPGVVIRSERPFETHPQITHIRERRESIEPAMEKRLLQLYIQRREGYEISHYNSNYAFVMAHSDEITGGSYAQMYTSSNPQSPAAMLGYSGQRLVAVDNVSINNKVEPRTANVTFTTELINVASGNAKTRWTAQVQYYYTPFTATEGKDSDGHPTLTTQDPQFQVVGYAVTQAP